MKEGRKRMHGIKFCCGRQNLNFDLCECRHSHQSCLGANDLHVSECLSPVWLGCGEDCPGTPHVVVRLSGD
jgi:hypothetical protein